MGFCGAVLRGSAMTLPAEKRRFWRRVLTYSQFQVLLQEMQQHSEQDPLGCPNTSTAENHCAKAWNKISRIMHCPVVKNEGASYENKKWIYMQAHISPMIQQFENL